MSESGPFYDRYPHWSQMGRMVEDTRAAIDALEKDSMVDAQRVYLFGYSMGGMVGAYTAALDPRVKGVVSICGFTPMRTDTADRGTGGVARYSHERGLIPRLGFFVGHEAADTLTISRMCSAPSRRGRRWCCSRSSIGMRTLTTCARRGAGSKGVWLYGSAPG